jgi:S1-C subfamily serine protease
MGYPLSALLGNRINITQGIVSSTEGVGGDWTNIQISVPVQPGNSGGPLLDLEGRVKGVVVAKLKPRILASGDVMIPEQVNFAVRNEVVRGFLRGNGVIILEVPSGGKDARKPTADIAESSRPSVVQLLCKSGV